MKVMNPQVILIKCGCATQTFNSVIEGRNYLVILYACTGKENMGRRIKHFLVKKSLKKSFGSRDF